MKLMKNISKYFHYQRLMWGHDTLRIEYVDTKNLAILSELKDLEDEMNDLAGKKIWLGSNV